MRRSATAITWMPGEPPYLHLALYQGQLVVPLTEWHRSRTHDSTHKVYKVHVSAFAAWLLQEDLPWDAPPDQMARIVIRYLREQMHLRVRRAADGCGVQLAPTAQTPLKPSTIKVAQAALRDLYEALIEEKLYRGENPLTAAAVTAVARRVRSAARSLGAPDSAGIRAEEQRAARKPSALARWGRAYNWRIDPRKTGETLRRAMLADVHAMLAVDPPFRANAASPLTQEHAQLRHHAMMVRDRAVIWLLLATGARLHEITSLTAGGLAACDDPGQAMIRTKGSAGQEVKLISFDEPVVAALHTYLTEGRPILDRARHATLTACAPDEAVFLSQRGAPLAADTFYRAWRRLHAAIVPVCPLGITPHDLRHLFVTHVLAEARRRHGAGTPAYAYAKHLLIVFMAWEHQETVEVYTHSAAVEEAHIEIPHYQKALLQPPKGPIALGGAVPSRSEVIGYDAELRSELEDLAAFARQFQKERQ